MSMPPVYEERMEEKQIMSRIIDDTDEVAR
jgi:hypothetical protein